MVDYTQYDYLSVEVSNRIAVVTLNRPEKMNACNPEEHEELPRILRDIGRDPNVNAAVVTGAGKAFCVGGDFTLVERANQQPATELVPLMDSGRELVYAHIDLEKPIVAAVNGVCMGAGAALALLCDFIIVEEQARISDGHIRAAVAAGDGGALVWPLAMGLTKAKRYLLTADWLSASEAERLGLVTEVVPQGRSVERAMQIATRLANGPQTALRYTKRALNQWLRHAATTAFDYSLYLEAVTMVTPECRDAIASIQETGVTAIADDPGLS